MSNPFLTLHNLRVMVRLSKEALAGPLGYREREDAEEKLAYYERLLEDAEIATAEGEMNP